MLTLQPRRARFRGLILQILWRETEKRCNRDGHDFEALYCKYCGAKLKTEKPREFVNERPNDERF